MNQSPKTQCECRQSKCIRNIVQRYFQYIQVAENAVADRAADNEAMKNWILDATSIGLDILGIIDPFGIFADLL